MSGLLHQDQYQIPVRAPKLPHTVAIYPLAKAPKHKLQKNELIGVAISDLGRLRLSAWRHRINKLVLLHTISFENKQAYNTHRLLRAIDNNTLLSKLPASEQGLPSHVPVQPSVLRHQLQEYEKLADNAQSVLDKCGVTFDFRPEYSHNQKTYTHSTSLDVRLLRKLTYAGLAYRYPQPTAQVHERIEKELQIIVEKGFVSYFLITWKILKYARSKGYFYVGRGSGANSIVAYLLRITDVDPVELDLYFERFINLYRSNPPDFDIDFSWTDRDDVTEYIFSRFKHCALIAVYNTFKYKAAVRELGKVFGLPKSEIDKLSLGAYNIEKLDKLSLLVLRYGQRIQGFPNYLGIHAGGILISEEPIHTYTATYMPPKGFATTMFDMVVAEDVGLHKFDILSQRGLGKIKDAVQIIKYNQPQAELLDVHNIQAFKKDEGIRKILSQAKAIGCFYVESPAMRMLLCKLQADNYLALVAASSVIRPGVAQSGMMREYIIRYRQPEKRKDAHPVMLDIMPETFGVMVYQEDVIKVAHFFGGLTLGEADMLRRGMSGKYRSKEEFMKVRDKFFDNCAQSKKPLAMVEEVWRQIESFAGYAFAKGHSASYAVESYQSLYLKAHFPLEYMVATINNFGGFYSTELYVHEARMHGASILPPCINTSYNQTIIQGKDIYIGFMFIQSFESKNVHTIVRERTTNGGYTSLHNFIERVPISLEQVAILIKLNAFRFTGKNKRELLWEAHMKLNKLRVKEQPTFTLFRTESINYKTPELYHTMWEDAFDEIELLGFPLCSPFALLREPPTHTLQASQLKDYLNKSISIYGYLVTAKRTRTGKGDTMYFGTFLDTQGHFIDTVLFPPVAAQYKFRGKGIYLITGKPISEFDFITIEVQSMELLPIIEDPRYADKTKKAV